MPKKNNVAPNDVIDAGPQPRPLVSGNWQKESSEAGQQPALPLPATRNSTVRGRNLRRRTAVLFIDGPANFPS